MTVRIVPLCRTLIGLSLVPALLLGQAPPPDLAAENRALVQRLVLEHAAIVASKERIADEREEQLLVELAAKDRRLRAEQGTRKAAQAELAKVTEERQRLVDQIAGRDRRFAAEIEEYRRQVASIADSPDPRKREALKRYAEGDRAGGFDALVAIQKAETKAVAAGWREIAALAQDRKDRGEMGTAEVIPLYETAQTMDPDYTWGWIELRRLYQEAGRLPDARRAAEQALTHAQSDRDRSAAEIELGNVLIASGDLAGARARLETGIEALVRLLASNPDSMDVQRDFSVYLKNLGDLLVASGDLADAFAVLEFCLEIHRHLAATNPSSADAQRDLGVSLTRLGDVLFALDDLVKASARFEEAFKIHKSLVAMDPSSAEAQRDLSVSLERLGDVLFELDDLEGGRARFEESLKIRESLAKSNPSSVEAQRDLSIGLNKLGDVLVALSDLMGARARFEESLKIRERLVALDPSNAEAQRDLGTSLNRLGNVLAALGDLEGARGRFEESLTSAERLAMSNRESVAAQRDLIVSHANLAGLPGGERHWSEALRIVLSLQSQGRLAPSDAWMIDELRKQVAAAEKAKP